MGRANNLLNNTENPKFFALLMPFGIYIYEKGKKIGEVVCEEDIRCFTGDEDWWFGDGSTIGTT